MTSRKKYDDGDFEATFKMHRQDKDIAVKQADIIDAGAPHCTLRVYDESIVFNFTQTEDVGTIVSVNPEVGQNLLSFLTQTLERLHEDSPQRVRVPSWVGD